MGEARTFKNQGGVLSPVHFLIRGPNGELRPEQFTRLDDAWLDGCEVVVVDRYGQHHTLYDAYRQAMIYLKPILPKKRDRDPV